MRQGSDPLSGPFPVSRLLRFSLPSVFTVLSMSVYGVVDGFFVSNWCGKGPFAALNLIWPFAMLLSAAGAMLGAGGNALVALRLGRGARRTAHGLFSACLLVDVALGAALAAAGLLALRPVARLLGAEGETLEDCVRYGRIVVAFVPAGMVQYFFQTFMVTAGRARENTAITFAAGALNAVLDALFLAAFGWGLEGAALATGLGQLLGAAVPLAYFLRPNHSALRLARPVWSLPAIGKACWNGSSELLANIAMPLVSMLYNWQLMRLAGEDGVAAWGLVMYVAFVFVAFFLGYAMAATPVVGYKLGAGDAAELRGILRRSAALLLFVGAAMAAAGWALSGPMAVLIAGYDPALRDLSAHAGRIYSLSYFLAGTNIFASAFFTGLNDGGRSAFVSFIRTFAFAALFVLLLPAFWGVEGVWWATAATECATAAVAFAMLRRAVPGRTAAAGPDRKKLERVKGIEPS